MKVCLQLLIIVAFVAFAATSSIAATYYVSELFGDDSNEGSEAAPWATIQKAADVMVAGDTVIVAFGTYNETLVPKNSGAESSPIVYKSEEVGEAEITTGIDYLGELSFSLHSGSVYMMENVYRTVDGFTEDRIPLLKKEHLDSLIAGSFYHDRADGKLYVWSSDDADPGTHTDSLFFQSLSFDIFEGSNLTIDGFTIKEGIQAVVGPNEESLPGIVIQNNTFDNEAFGLTAVYINGGPADSVHTYEDFLVADNIFENNANLRIYNAGRSSVVSGNTFNGDPPSGEVGTANIRVRGSDEGYPGAQTQGLIIERNFFNYPNARAIYFKYDDIEDVTVQNNIFFNGYFGLIRVRMGQNINIINNTFFYNAQEGHPVRYGEGIAGSIYNNIVANLRDSYFWFIDNKNDSTLLVDLDYNYYVTDTSLTSSRDDQLVRLRVVESGEYISSASFPGGPHAVYGHPMKAWTEFPLIGDSMFVPPTGDTVYVESSRILATGDTVAVESIPDMWFSDPYPLFVDPDTGAATPAKLSLAEGSNAIDAGLASVAPAVDFFGNPRDANPDIGAVEYGATSVESIVDIIPKGYALSQNYPNPFNAVTTIEYKLPKSERIQLSVYNVLGQKVTTLYNGIHMLGTYSIKWDGKNDHGEALPSGIYFYRLKTDAYTKTAKMILLK